MPQLYFSVKSPPYKLTENEVDMWCEANNNQLTTKRNACGQNFFKAGG